MSAGWFAGGWPPGGCECKRKLVVMIKMNEQIKFFMGCK
jgi:hypothetical protein